jgi:putative ABC transport system permease protein
MIKNYLIVALRNMRRQKIYSFINLSGLAIGMACCVLILLFVQYEWSYQRYHENAYNIYRVERDINFQDIHGTYPVTAHPYAHALKSDFPEIKEAVRIWPSETDYLDQNHQYNRGYFIYADATVFDVFTWPLIQGNSETALIDPYSIVITEGIAERYFPDEDPIGKTLTMQWGKDYDFKVTGVMNNVLENSHFTFDAIASYSTLNSILGEEELGIWFSNSIYTYLLLQKNANPQELESKLPDWQEKYVGNRARELMGPEADINKFCIIKLKPLTDIHLYSHLEHEIQPNGNVTTVYIFSAIALLILLIACINFMNLSTARSLNRAKEVGLRKVVGAERGRLILQFLSESILLSFIALFFAIILIEILLPVFNSLTGIDLKIAYLKNILIPVGFLVIAIIVGLLAGSYPAFVLSAFQPISVLKGKFKSSSRGATLRKGLVVLQFSISITLIIGTLIVMSQLKYLRNKQLGFNKEHVVVIPNYDANLLPTNMEVLRNEMLNDPAIISVGTSSRIPGNRRFGDTMFRKSKTGDAMEDMVNIQNFEVSQEFLTTIGAEIIAGRNFSRKFPTDTSGGYIINEAAAKKIGWESPEIAVSKEFGRATGINPVVYTDGKIVGVVKDFHFKSLHQKIEPVVMECDPKADSYILVRIQPGNILETLSFLEDKMRQFSPTYPFEYFFEDEYFNNLYRSEERIQEIFGYFTFLAILIACLGLFGLASFTTEQRRKEIGVRKVLGASLANIIFLLTKEFLKWVIIANLIAWPIAWWILNKWLQNFAYHIDIEMWVFVISGGIALVIAVITVSYQAVKAAFNNPIEALRYE